MKTDQADHGLLQMSVSLFSSQKQLARSLFFGSFAKFKTLIAHSIVCNFPSCELRHSPKPFSQHREQIAFATVHTSRFVLHFRKNYHGNFDPFTATVLIRHYFDERFA